MSCHRRASRQAPVRPVGKMRLVRPKGQSPKPAQPERPSAEEPHLRPKRARTRASAGPKMKKRREAATATILATGSRCMLTMGTWGCAYSRSKTQIRFAHPHVCQDGNRDTSDQHSSHRYASATESPKLLRGSAGIPSCTRLCREHTCTRSSGVFLSPLCLWSSGAETSSLKLPPRLGPQPWGQYK